MCRSLKRGIVLLGVFIGLVLFSFVFYRGYQEVVFEIEVLSFRALRVRFPVVFD